MNDPKAKMPEAERPFRFTKMSGTGNDFIVFDNRTGDFTGAESEFFSALCRRGLSVGADGVILMDAPVRMRYFNSDGGEAALCGNGARCAARFAFDKGFVRETRFVLEAEDGPHDVEVSGDEVRLRMSRPRGLRKGLGICDVAGLSEGGFLDTGVPHFVLWVESPEALESLDVAALAPPFRRHPAFPNGANVDFACVLDRRSIAVRTFERGVEAETLSCGTGCVAAALIGASDRGLVSPVAVRTRGGALSVFFDAGWIEVWLSGSAVPVFEGVLAAGAGRGLPLHDAGKSGTRACDDT
jgi:diaminopimelate epimerase